MNQKLFIFTFPFVGHTNPVLAFCKELTQNHKHIEITMYSNTNFQPVIETCDVEFRDYNFKVKIQSDDVNASEKVHLGKMNKVSIDFAYEIAPKLLKDVLRDQPDMIMYDRSCLFARLTVEYILSEYKKRKLQPFKLISYSTTFLFGRQYPNNYEIKLLNLPFTILFYLILIFFKKLFFYLRHGIFNRDPRYRATNERLESESVITFTFPELQPRSHLLDRNVFKFVGISFDEEFNAKGHKVIENCHVNIDLKSDKELVYVAFGSILTNQINTYVKIINALKLVNEQRPIKAVIATGNSCYSYLEKQHEIPDFITLVRMAQQKEILKVASLFVTHSGMNSTSESIHFGVPMVCIPMSADQPLVAYRVADELGLGVRLNRKTLNETILKDSILRVLSDRDFKERCRVYKDYSMRYNGVDNTVKIILDSLGNRDLD